MSPTDKTALALVFISAIQAIASAGTAAQSSDTRSRTLQLAASSELGILEYCLDKGLVDETAVAAQRQRNAKLLKAEAANTVGLAEQEAGRVGFLAFDGLQGRFEESAQAQGLTLKTACENRAAVAKAMVSR